MRKALLALTLTLGIVLPGCSTMRWWAYVLTPSSATRKVRPDSAIPAFGGKTVAVTVFASPKTQLEHEMAQLEVSYAVSSEMRKRLAEVRTIDPRRIFRYQDENPRWDELPPDKLCRTLRADYVLLISLMEFSTRERGSMHLARGRITAEVALYGREQVETATGEEYIWRVERIQVVYPETAPVGTPTRDDTKTRARTMLAFAEKLVRNFYEYEVAKEP